MPEIGEEQIAEAYRYAKLVYAKSVSLKAAKLDIERKTGMVPGSSSGYIRVFLRMIEGRQYERTLNPEATDYYLEGIYRDFGHSHLSRALSAVAKHLAYYEKKSKNASKQPKICEIYSKHLKKVQEPATESEYFAKLEQEVAESLKDSSANRKARLMKANPVPLVHEVFTKVFVRNPDVVAEVLLRAGGTCERCRKEAPFIRASNRTPYLEVHHQLPLFKGGEDTVENALALCPNCHRELHFGISA